MSTEVVSPGNFNLDKVTLVEEDTKQFIDLKPIVVSCTVNESMNKRGSQLQLIVADINDTLGLLPVRGHERIVIDWKADDRIAGEGELRQEAFRIINIGDVKTTTEIPGHGYQIIAISEFAWHEPFFEWDEYIEDTIEGIVKAVHNKVLNGIEGPTDFGSTGAFALAKTDATDGVIEFVGPGEKPFQTIEMLSSWAYSSSFPSSAWYYFKNKDGYNWRSIESIAAEGPIDKYFYDPTEETSLSESVNPVNREISSWKGQNRGNIWHMAKKGKLQNEVKELDYLKKKVILHEFNYKGDQPKPFGAYAYGAPSFYDKFGTKTTETHWLYHGQERFEYQPDGLKHKWSMYSAMENDQLNIMVPGNSKLTCGKVLEVQIPVQRSMKEHDDPIPYDQFVTGKYVIRDVLHMFNQQGYFAQLTLIRSGSATQQNS